MFTVSKTDIKVKGRSYTPQIFSYHKLNKTLQRNNSKKYIYKLITDNNSSLAYSNPGSSKIMV